MKKKPRCGSLFSRSLVLLLVLCLLSASLALAQEGSDPDPAQPGSGASDDEGDGGGEGVGSGDLDASPGEPGPDPGDDPVDRETGGGAEKAAGAILQESDWVENLEGHRAVDGFTVFDIADPEHALGVVCMNCHVAHQGLTGYLLKP